MSNSSGNEAHREYTQRRNSAQESVDACERKHITVGNVRLAVFVAALAIAWLAFFRHQLAFWWLGLPLVTFLVLLFVHDRILRRKTTAERRVRYYERGLSRMEERWRGTGSTGERFAPAVHPYAADLDLFGPASMFELISTARTGVGEKRLAGWLLAPASIPEIKDRHEAIRELRTAIDFRERLAVAGTEPVTEKQAEPLSKWGESGAMCVTPIIRIVALVLSVIMAFALLWFTIADFEWLAGEAAKPPLNAFRLVVTMALFNGGFALLFRKKVHRAIEQFDPIRTGLALLSDLLVEIEHTEFESLPLQRLKANLGRDPRPSRQIARLNRYSDLLDSRENLFVRIFGPPLLWTTQVSLAIEWWRSRYGRTARAWVDAVAELEALNSLATYSYEHPHDPFPELIDDGPVLIGRALGHPLVPKCVPNSVALNPEQRLLIVSGSNMSGKSTLLRTVGINAVLAFAGAPIRGLSLDISPLRVGASLHISDSLAEGDSHFSAEIKRIRMIVDLAENHGPALFLIDEILQGTNSHDRLTGTRAILERLLNRNAIGLITTHDLALTDLAGAMGSIAANVHFRDEIRDGRMVFDYTLKPGVVTGSNAVELMRLYGLIG
jgi:hypothetical protein